MKFSRIPYLSLYLIFFRLLLEASLDCLELYYFFRLRLFPPIYGFFELNELFCDDELKMNLAPYESFF